MAYKLRTSKQTQEIFSKIAITSGLQPFALSKIAIALSIKSGKLNEHDFSSDNDGLELSRQTIFGDYDLLYKSIICTRAGNYLPDGDYFPRIVKAHLDRGAKLLNEENRYSKNLFIDLCNLEKNI